MKLLLIRHGKTSWNLDKKLQGRQDTSLDSSGVAEVGQWKLPDDVDIWYVSPLRRARQTAEILGLQNCSVSNELIEMHWGNWEGYSIDELRQLDPVNLEAQESRGLDMLPPSGESPRQVQSRFGQFLQALNTQASTGAITHKGVIQVALDLALGGNHYSEPVVKIRSNLGYLFNWENQQLEFSDEVSLL